MNPVIYSFKKNGLKWTTITFFGFILLAVFLPIIYYYTLTETNLISAVYEFAIGSILVTAIAYLSLKSENELLERAKNNPVEPNALKLPMRLARDFSLLFTLIFVAIAIFAMIRNYSIGMTQTASLHSDIMTIPITEEIVIIWGIVTLGILAHWLSIFYATKMYKEFLIRKGVTQLEERMKKDG